MSTAAQSFIKSSISSNINLMILRSHFTDWHVILCITFVLTQIPAHYTSSSLVTQLCKMCFSVNLRGCDSVTSADFYNSFTSVHLKHVDCELNCPEALF